MGKDGIEAAGVCGVGAGINPVFVLLIGVFCRLEGTELLKSAGVGRNETFPPPPGDDLVENLRAGGGGRAPEGRCGALHAACLIASESEREAIRQAFLAEFGTEICRELKQSGIPCAVCVAAAARLLGEVQSR